MKKFLENPVTNDNLLLLLILQSINILAINMEVNKEVTIPINKVVAKPFMGPEPKINNTPPVKMWVTFASTIERIAPFQL